jgi:phage pi2 protein 07
MSVEKNKNDLNFDELIAQALEKQQKEFELKLKQRDKNSIELGCQVVEMIIVEGKPKLDKETKVQIEIGGELVFYPNKYNVKLSFVGGELETPITKQIFDSLKINERYLALGRLGEVKEFGNALLKPIFSHFQEI